MLILIEIEKTVVLKPKIYNNRINNYLNTDRFDLSILERSIQQYEPDASIYDNIIESNNDDNNDSEFLKSYKSFLSTFDEVLDNDYDSERKDYNKESILMKVIDTAAAKSHTKKRGPKPKVPGSSKVPGPSPKVPTIKESVPAVGQKRKSQSEVVKVTTNKRAKALEYNSFMRKWIACDDPARASTISTDVLRCLVSELKNGTNGHEIYEVQESIANLLIESIVDYQDDDLQPEAQDSLKKIYDMPLNLQLTLKDMVDDDLEASNQHKASRIATSLGSECFNKIRDTQTNAHVSLVAARRETSRNIKFNWETGATMLRVSLHNLKKVSISDIPDGANRLVNPFSSSGSKAEDKINFEQWKWLTAENGSTDMETFEHPGIHPNSMFYGKVAAKFSLHNSIAPILEETPSATISGTSLTFDAVPEHLTVPLQKVNDIIKKDYGLIIIDKNHDMKDGINNIQNTDIESYSVHYHRACLIYDILRRQLFGNTILLYYYFTEKII